MTILRELENITKIIKEGKFENALELIGKLEEREDLSNDDQIEIILLKSTALMRLGEFKLSSEILSTLIGREVISSLQVVDAMIVKAESLMRQGEFDEGLRVVEESEEFILQPLDQVNPEDISKRQIILLRRKGSLYLYKGEINNALKFTQKSLNLANEIQETSLISGALNNMGLIFQHKGDNEKALDHFQRSFAIDQELGDKFGMATCLGNIGVINRRKGEFNKALENYKQSLDICQEIGNKDGYATTLFQLGDIFSTKGELEEALDHYQKSLIILEEIGNNFYIGVVLAGIGDVYRQKGDFHQADEYFKRSLTLYEEIGYTQYVVENLMLLVVSAINAKAFSKAEDYLEQLQHINESENDQVISQNYRLAEALLLKSGTRMSDKVKAQEILLKLVNEEAYAVGIRFYGMLSLCELLVEEVKLFGEEEVQEQVKSLLTRIHEFTLKENATPLLVQSLILQAKFALVEGNAQQANTLLEQAKVTTEESGLKLLADKVLKEQEHLQNELDKWKELFHRNAPLVERLDKAQLNDYISTALNLVRAGKN